jgi:hypothetical protein
VSASVPFEPLGVRNSTYMGAGPTGSSVSTPAKVYMLFFPFVNG